MREPTGYRRTVDAMTAIVEVNRWPLRPTPRKGYTNFLLDSNGKSCFGIGIKGQEIWRIWVKGPDLRRRASEFPGWQCVSYYEGRNQTWVEARDPESPDEDSLRRLMEEGYRSIQGPLR